MAKRDKRRVADNGAAETVVETPAPPPSEPPSPPPAPRVEVLRTFMRDLPVRLSIEELAGVARDLAGTIEDTEQEEAEQAEEKAAMKERLAGLKARQRKLATRLRRGLEERPVEIRIDADFAAGTATEVRTDTGEVLLTRPLSDAERQPKLLPDTAAAADGAMAVSSEAAEAEAK